MTSQQTTTDGFLGVIMLDTRFPRPPGDIGSPATWARAGIPVRFVTVPGASARRVVRAQDPALLAPFVDAARGLARQGARLITTSCGFLVAWQTELQAAVDVPVITSSLLQCAGLSSPGIVTFDAASLHADLLQRAGVLAGTPVVGLPPGCELQSRIQSDDTELDLRQASDDVVDAAVRLLTMHPELQHVVLECTNMPPYRNAVAQATGRTVHDLETLLLTTWRELHTADQGSREEVNPETRGRSIQNAAEPASPGRQRCPLGGDAPQVRRGGSHNSSTRRAG